MKTLLFLIFTTLATSIKATTFVPTSPERLIKESNAVIHAKYLGKSYKKISTGDVVTEGNFAIIKSAGLTGGEIINKNSFKVIYPGGVWLGVTYKVHGTPRFKEGEEVVLLLRKSKFGYIVNSLTAGKFIVDKEYGKEDKLVSSAFPNHNRFGVISYSDFNSIVENNFDTGLEEIHTDKFVYKKNNEVERIEEIRASRSVASIEQDDSLTNVSSYVWFAVVFGFLGAFYLRFIRKEDKQ